MSDPKASRCLERVDTIWGELRCVRKAGHPEWHGALPPDDKHPMVMWQVKRMFVSGQATPLYVNHHRPEPTWGDVVRSAHSADTDDASTWMWTPTDDGTGRWLAITSNGEQVWCDRRHLPEGLLLLVDGETGRMVLE